MDSWRDMRLSKSGLDAPCGGCMDRHAGCHSECEAYQAYRTMQDAYLKQKNEDLEIANATWAGRQKAADAYLRKHGTFRDKGDGGQH